MVFLGFSFVFFCFLLFFLLAEGIITIGRTHVKLKKIHKNHKKPLEEDVGLSP